MNVRANSNRQPRQECAQLTDRIDIVTALAAIDLDRVYRWIAKDSYWAEHIPRDVFDRAIRGSICFAALDAGQTIGFARVVTDRATFAYLGDVFVARERRGQGISERLMQAIMAHEDLQGLRRWLLMTRDAHGLYEKFGFKSLAVPGRCMERADPDVFKRLVQGAS